MGWDLIFLWHLTWNNQSEISMYFSTNQKWVPGTVEECLRWGKLWHIQPSCIPCTDASTNQRLALFCVNQSVASIYLPDGKWLKVARLLESIVSDESTWIVSFWLIPIFFIKIHLMIVDPDDSVGLNFESYERNYLGSSSTWFEDMTCNCCVSVGHMRNNRRAGGPHSLVECCLEQPIRD